MGQDTEDADLSRKRPRDQFIHSPQSSRLLNAENGGELRLERSSTAAAVDVRNATEEAECQQRRQRSRSSSLEPSSDKEEVGLFMGKAHHGNGMEVSMQKLAWLEGHRKKAAACEEEGDLMFARDLLQEALPVAVQAAEEGFYDVSCLGQHLAELANVCYQLGDTAEAIDYYTRSIEQERMALAHKHQQSPSTTIEECHCFGLLHSMEAVCRIYVEVQQFNDALCVYKEIYDIELEVSGPNSLRVASTLCNMGFMHYMLQLYKPSLHFYQEALRIRSTFLEGFKNASLPTITLEKSIGHSLNTIGILYFKLGRLNAASSAFKCSLMIREKVLGPYHQDVTTLWYNLAMVRVEARDECGAIPLYREGLRRDRIRLCDDFHPDLSPKLQYLGEILIELGDLDHSLLCFQQALEAESRAAKTPMIKTNDARHRLVSLCRLLNIIGNIHLMQADISAAMTCFVQVARIAAKLPARGTLHIPLVVGGHMCHLARLHPRSAAAA